MNSRVWRAKYYVFERKDFADCESTKKTENIGGDFSVFRDRAGWFAQKETAHSFFPELVTNDYPVGDLCTRCGDAQEIDA